MRLFVDSKGYTGFMVQDWKENDKWQRRQFKGKEAAKSFAAIVAV